jgi:hypothetical protein
MRDVLEGVLVCALHVVEGVCVLVLSLVCVHIGVLHAVQQRRWVSKGTRQGGQIQADTGSTGEAERKTKNLRRSSKEGRRVEAYPTHPYFLRAMPTLTPIHIHTCAPPSPRPPVFSIRVVRWRASSGGLSKVRVRSSTCMEGGREGGGSRAPGQGQSIAISGVAGGAARVFTHRPRRTRHRHHVSILAGYLQLHCSAAGQA